MLDWLSREGHKKTNTNGERIMRLVKNHNLKIINTDNRCTGKWTWMRQSQKSIIDYVLAGNRVNKNITRMIIDETGQFWDIGGDHSWISVELKYAKSVKRQEDKQTEKWNIHQHSDWGKFKEEMEKEMGEWEDQMGDENIHEAMVERGYEELVKAIIRVGQKTIGKSKGPKKMKKNYQQRKMIKRRNRAARQWRKANKQGDVQTAEKWSEFLRWGRKIKRSRARQKMKIAAKWRAKMILEGGTSSRNFWRDISEKGTRHEINIVEDESGTTSKPEGIRRKIEEHLRALGEETENVEYGGESWGENKFAQRIGEEITIKELSEEMKGLRNGKAVGLDDIPNEFIKYGGDGLRKALAKLFTGFTKWEWTPEEWAQERVTLLHKGKTKRNLDNYRGISISSNIGKLFCKIISKRLRGITEEERWLGETQAGFRENRGTTDNLFVLTNLMERAKRKKTKLYVAFVDLRKAYDRVWREGLWRCLIKRGLGGKPLNILKQLYRGHKKRVNTAGGPTAWIKCNRGVKQGCVLSPLLFAIYIADIAEKIQSGAKGVKIDELVHICTLFFADDMVLIAESEKDLALQIQILEDSLREKKLEINYEKTEIIQIGEKIGQERQWMVLNNQGKVKGTIKETKMYKYLGVRLGKSRTFVHHERNIVNNIARRVGITKMRARETKDMVWAADEIWSKIMKPGIMYGAEVIPFKKKTVSTIEIAQNKIGRWAMGLSRSAPRCGIRAEMGWTTISGEIAKRKVTFWGRLVRMGEYRWPKRILKLILREEEENEWYSETRKATMWLGDTMEDITDKNWKSKVYKRWKDKEEMEWWAEAREQVTMVNYSKMNWGSREIFLDGSKESKTLCRYRVGDIGYREDKIERGWKCHRCQETTILLAKHIIQDCKWLDGERKTNGIQEVIKQRKTAGTPEEDVIKDILSNTSKTRQKQITALHIKWMKPEQKTTRP